MPRASAKAMPMNSVAVCEAAADGLRSARQVVAGDVAHTHGGARHADASQTGAEILSQLTQIFHVHAP